MADYGLVGKYWDSDYWPNTNEYWPTTGAAAPVTPRIFTPAAMERMLTTERSRVWVSTMTSEERVLKVESDTRKDTETSEPRIHKVEKS